MNKAIAIVSAVTVFALLCVANSAEVKKQPALTVDRNVKAVNTC